MKGLAGAFSSKISAVAGSAASIGSRAIGAGAAAAVEAGAAVAGSAVSVGSMVVEQTVRVISSAPPKEGMKVATIRFRMGDNVNDGMYGKVRIVIIGDCHEDPEGPRAPAHSTGDEDGYDLGTGLWKFGSTESVRINNLPKNVNPTVILVYNDSAQGRHWYVRRVEIETEAYAADGGGDNGLLKTYVFPCYSYVPNSSRGRVIFEGSSLLPWKTPARLNELYREGALHRQLEVYQFDQYDDLSSPPELADRGSHNYRPPLHPYPKRQANTISGKSVSIPIDDDFDTSKTYDFFSEAVRSKAKAVFADPLSLNSSKPWKSVKKLIDGLFVGVGAYRMPAVLKHGIDWRSDKEFGRQRLAGMNPMEITLVDALPEGFSVSDADLGDALPAGLTLASAVEAKRVFIIDFSLLEVLRPIVNRPPLPGRDLRYLYAPRCLLLRDDDDDVIPIAVELERGGKVYTRAKDTSVGKWQWTLAKAYVASADSAVHQVGRHYLECHAVCEVYLIALRRRVSEWHPLFKLLIPHFRFTMSINYRARTSLINAGGIIESVFTPGPKCMAASAELFKSWKFLETALPVNLEKRGVADSAVLPYYPYRDAGMHVWNAILNYCRTYLKIYYGEGESAIEAIARDEEVASWWADVKVGASKGEFSLPEEEEWPALHTVEHLALICATMIWTASAQHSAVNFGQYDYSAFSPNNPSCMRKPMPEGVDERAFMEALPLPKDQMTVITVVDLLSRFSDDEEYIGRTDQTAFGWLVDPEAREAYKKFCDDLDDAMVAIDRMNQKNKPKGRMPYELLFPRNNARELSFLHDTPNGTRGIPNSVSI